MPRFEGVGRPKPLISLVSPTPPGPTIPFRPETAPFHGGVKLAEFRGFLGVYERISGNGDAPFGALAPILRIRLCGPVCTTTDPLAGDLALELGEGKQHVEGQPPHRGGGIELLGDRHERNLVRIEHLDDLGEVGKRTGQPVDLVDHHRIDLVGLNVGEKLLQGRAVQGAAGQATVVVGNAGDGLDQRIPRWDLM